MSDPAPGTYLETEILTATPQKLRLMLIDAAIRSTQRTRQHWSEGRIEAGGESLVHAQHIVAELLSGLNREASPDLAKKLSAIYMFVSRRLSEAAVDRDLQKLDDAVMVLEEDRQTWREVCQQSGQASPVEKDAVKFQPGGGTAPKSTPHCLGASSLQDHAAGRLSLEA